MDDDPFVCTVVRKTLSRDQYRVETVTRPEVALQRLAAEPFDLLLTDISMPEINGLELAERARAQHASLGIVVMTGYGSFDNISRAVRTGIADFITKPFDIEELRLTVARALERQRLQRNNVRLQTLVKVFEYSQTINSTLDLDALYHIVIDIVRRETGATAVMIWIADEQDPCVAASGIDADQLSAVEDLARHVFATAQVPSAQHGMPIAPGRTGKGAVMALPLAVHDERLGVLVAAYDDGQKAALAELLAIIANQTSLAIRNARQFAALRELDHLKSEFIGIASHELRTPLSLVLGYSSLLRQYLQSHESGYLQQVLKGAHRISDIVDDLVNLRQSDLQQMTLDLTVFDVWEMLRETVAELRALANEREIPLHLQHPSEPLLIRADRDKITLALANLVDNALKFNRPGGSVTIIGTYAATNRREVRIDVCDTGIGITQRDLSRIFERFYQTAPSITRIRNGMGIGLAITKSFVEVHGGRVQVESTPGRGSTFHVYLPVAPPDG
ncbi:MAG TPA: ATP-binding protein [Herpetosiphonaceae bacterium]